MPTASFCASGYNRCGGWRCPHGASQTHPQSKTKAAKDWLYPDHDAQQNLARQIVAQIYSKDKLADSHHIHKRDSPITTKLSGMASGFSIVKYEMRRVHLIGKAR